MGGNLSLLPFFLSKIEEKSFVESEWGVVGIERVIEMIDKGLE